MIAFHRWFLIALVIVLVAITAQLAGAEKTKTTGNALPADVQAIFDTKPCFTCHKLGDRGEGVLAPNLRYVGDRRSKAWLTAWLKNPVAVRKETIMPPALLTDLEIEVMADFLVKQRSRVSFPRLLKAAKGDQVAAGKALFQARDCVTCHKIDGQGGNAANTAPDLKAVSTRHDPKWLATWLADPQKVKPGTFMPTFRLSKAEIRALVAYFQTL